nr:MAG TPA: DNA helicase [Bacteriophage sp.]
MRGQLWQEHGLPAGQIPSSRLLRKLSTCPPVGF